MSKDLLEACKFLNARWNTLKEDYDTNMSAWTKEVEKENTNYIKCAQYSTECKEALIRRQELLEVLKFITSI